MLLPLEKSQYAILNNIKIFKQETETDGIKRDHKLIKFKVITDTI